MNGGAGDDQLWGGNRGADNAADTCFFSSGCGKDYVHAFEAGCDVIDLSFHGTGLHAVSAASTDLGWATVIDLGQLASDTFENKVVLMRVAFADPGQGFFFF